MRDDDAYFESVDGTEKPEAFCRTVKKATSTSSIVSHLSRGSSEYWDDFDDDVMRAMDNSEQQLEKLDDLECGIQLTQGCEVKYSKPIENHRPSRVGGTPDVCSPDTFKRDEAYSLGKRSLIDFQDASGTQVAAQRRKLMMTCSSRFNEKHRLTKSSEVADVFKCDARLPIVISHSDAHQPFFDNYKLSWGVQWEIARLVSSGRIQYDDIPLDTLKDLAGPNVAAAPLVEQLLCQQKSDIGRRQTYEHAFAKELNTKTPWAELDKEEEALRRHPLSGLGCNSDHDDWYGGKVAFVAKLRQKDRDQYYLELGSPELTASTRFMRRWGSRRFLRIRIPESILYQPNNQLLTYFKNKFVMHGRVFRPFYAKESTVFLFELDCAYARGRLVSDTHDGKISFNRFMQWHNPMVFNQNQSLAKWCARLALGLSNSVPGVEIAPENIYEIDDLYSPAGQTAIRAGRKPESKDVTTDGEGFTNQATLVYTKYKFNWELVPSAVQYRLGGAKGLLLLHPEDNGACDEPFRVWIRSSQKKIAYNPSASPDRAHLILDVLRRSHLKHPARLSTQIIVNLAQNGVSHEVFEGLMKEGLEDIATSLTQWSGQYAMEHLWVAVAGLNGSVIRARISREAACSSRVLGFTSLDKDEEIDEDEDTMELLARSKAWWADEISGCPSSLEETVLVLLDAGFEPQSCAILAMKLKEVFKKALNLYIEKYKIVVPRSAEAWMVPDPCGVLKPGEIFLKTSECLVGQDGLSRDHLLGDVLVTRHPCCVPSDVQKVRAVWRDELRRYCDVVIFSVQGERSLASMLGGGDYDGDTVNVIWEPTIVAAFRTPDNKYADPPPGFDEAFEKDTVTVEDLLNNHMGQHDFPSATSVDLQDYLLASLKHDSLVGQYSSWHDTAVYKFGYESDEAWRLAYMFCAVLDSSKTGKSVRPAVLKRDRLLYHGRPPAWKESLLDEVSSLPPEVEAPRRQGTLSQIEFIMDYLKNAARKQYHHHMAMFEKHLTVSRQQYKAHVGFTAAGLYVDPALEAPWLQAVERAQRLADENGFDRMKRELEMIQNHVQAVRERHRELVRQDNRGKGHSGRPSLPLRKNSHTFTDKPIEHRQNILRELSLAFNQMFDEAEFLVLSPEQVRRCRASYAYILETEYQEKRFPDGTRYSRFPFDVAMRELGIIKAESTGSCKMVNSNFYSVFQVTGAIKAFRSADSPGYTYLP